MALGFDLGDAIARRGGFDGRGVPEACQWRETVFRGTASASGRVPG